MIKNVIYLGYYLKKTNWKQFASQIAYANENFKRSKLHLFFDMLGSTLRRGNSFHEYYYYAFYVKNRKKRDTYATMGFMYEYQRRFNPPAKRAILENKIKFFEAFSEYIGRPWLKIQEVGLNEVEAFVVGSEKIVLKNSQSGGGKAVQIYSLKKYRATDLIAEASKHNFDIAEAFVYQHQSLQKLSPNSLNTIRFVTQTTNKNAVEIIGAMLRMGIQKQTDNLSSGGIACNIDIETGKICSDGVTFDISLPDFDKHPVSGISLIGFQIPYWKEVVEICKKATLKHTENKSIGWDVAITDDGPLLIEANNDWGARVWQMPASKGLKYKLVKYFDN